MSQQSIDQATHLQEAFSAFNRMSVQLESSYRDLENKVSELKEELAAARSDKLQQLAETEMLADRLGHLLDLLPGGVILIAADGTITQTNPMAEELLEESLPGKNWSELMSSHLEDDMNEYGEVSLKNGRHVTISRRSLEAEPGQIVLIMDVSEQYELKNILNREHRLAAMGEMAASLAHQIRTPLTTALLYASNFQKQHLSETDRERMSHKVIERLKHLEHMVNDLLRFTRGGSTATDNFTSTDLLEEFRKIIEPQIDQAEGRLVLPDTSEVYNLMGDQEAILGIFLNLANNSIQSTGKGVTVEISIESVTQQLLIFHIKDNGPGIPAAIADKIFTPFFTTRKEGTGLGLAVAQATLRAHRGVIRYLPEQVGARFEVSLALANADNMLPSGSSQADVCFPSAITKHSLRG